MPIYLQYWQLRCAFVYRRRNGLKRNHLFQGMVCLVGSLLERLGAPWGEITPSWVCKNSEAWSSHISSCRCFCCRLSLLSLPTFQILGCLCGHIWWRRLLSGAALQQLLPMFLNRSIRAVLIYFLHVCKLFSIACIFFIICCLCIIQCCCKSCGSWMGFCYNGSSQAEILPDWYVLRFILVRSWWRRSYMDNASFEFDPFWFLLGPLVLNKLNNNTQCICKACGSIGNRSEPGKPALTPALHKSFPTGALSYLEKDPPLARWFLLAGRLSSWFASQCLKFGWRNKILQEFGVSRKGVVVVNNNPVNIFAYLVWGVVGIPDQITLPPPPRGTEAVLGYGRRLRAGVVPKPWKTDVI